MPTSCSTWCPPGPSRPPLPDFQTLSPQPVLLSGVTLHQRKDSAFCLVELYGDPASPFFWPVQVPLHGTMIWNINHSWLVLPSNLLSVRSAPWSRSWLKWLNLLFPIHCLWEINRSKSACQCPCMNGASLSVTEQSEPPGLWTDHQWVAWRQPAVWTAQGNSWEWRQRHEGLGLGGEMDEHLSCWRTTKVTYSKWIRKLPRISRINWQWTNSQVFQLAFSLWTKVSGGVPDDCEWLWCLPCYLDFCCSSASEKEAGASKEDGCRSLWA